MYVWPRQLYISLNLRKNILVILRASCIINRKSAHGGSEFKLSLNKLIYYTYDKRYCRKKNR